MGRYETIIDPPGELTVVCCHVAVVVMVVRLVVFVPAVDEVVEVEVVVASVVTVEGTTVVDAKVEVGRSGSDDPGKRSVVDF